MNAGLKSNRPNTPDQILLVNYGQFDYKYKIMPTKGLVIDVHHHWIPDEHYRRPELHIHQDEEVIHEPDGFEFGALAYNSSRHHA